MGSSVVTEQIVANTARRCAAMNSSMFAQIYEDMCNNQSIDMIHITVVACCIAEDGRIVLSPWIPAPLAKSVRLDGELMTVRLSLTPSAIKYFEHYDNVISFECRTYGHIIKVNFCTDQLMEIMGFSRGHMVDHQSFGYLIYDAVGESAPQPKRPSLSLVK